MELVGISEWVGNGSNSRSATMFLIVSQTGCKYYMTANSSQERDMWLIHARRGLECNFANPAVSPFKPAKQRQMRSKFLFNGVCARTKNSIASVSHATVCKVCSRAFSSAEYVQENSPFLQLGVEESERCCTECKHCQSCILWLKCINHNLSMTIHDFTEAVRSDVFRFEATFSLRKKKSKRLEMASQLFEQQQINAVEFEELRNIDQQYSTELELEESSKLSLALDAIGDDMQMVIGLLLNPVSTDVGGRSSYYQVVLKLLSIGDREPALIDFYLPQLLQVHMLVSMNRNCASLCKVDLLEQALLSFAKKYSALAVKMTWLLVSKMKDFETLGNTSEKRVTQCHYSCSSSLLLQLELIVSGEISSIFDGASSRVLSEVLQPAAHQKDELRNELTCLFLLRRRVQELYDHEFHKCRGSSVALPSSKLVFEHASCIHIFENLGVAKSSQSSSSPVYEGDVSEIKLAKQIDFIDRLSEVVESLRFIHRSFRTEELCKELAKWNADPGCLGWEPCALAGEPAYKIVRIVIEDCRVFRTKARAPSLIVCEVLRQDFEEPVNCSAAAPATAMPEGQNGGTAPGTSHHYRKRGMTQSSEIAQGLHEVGGLVESSIGQAIADIQTQMSRDLSINEELTSGDNDIADDISTDQLEVDAISEPAVGKGASALPPAPLNSLSAIVKPRRTFSPFALSGEMRGRQRSDPPIDSPEASRSQLVNSSSKSAVSNRRIVGNLLSSHRKSHVLKLDKTIIESNPDEAKAGVVSTSQVELIFESAKKLLRDGTIDQTEFELLISSDGNYRRENARVEAEIAMTRVESAFGESWQAKKERILGDRLDTTNDGWPLWDLKCFIVKSNDDLRQEVCCLQIMQLCYEIFDDYGLGSQLWLHPNRIICTGNSTGIVQVIPDSMSLDALKKTRGFVSLPAYFKSTYGTSAERLSLAKQNFMSSLAAYSLFSYILMIKDRHNGNILLDTEGHIIHIDFGFMLSIAPGGSFSLETAPFKLTEEMVDVLGGLESALFGEFVKAFTAGFLALRANAESIIVTLQILAQNSPYPCFLGKDASVIIERLRSRFRCDLSVKEVVQHCLDLVISSYGNYGTKQYDTFQWYTNGITQ